MRNGKLKVIFNSNPVEFKPESVVLSVSGQLQELANDYVWIFAGGVPPNDFLKKIGVGFGMRDMTGEASRESQQARLAGERFAEAGVGGKESLRR